MNALRQWLRHWCLTEEQRRVIDALEMPQRWMPQPDITKAEAEEWGKVLASPVLRRIDAAMINRVCDEAQRVLIVPVAEMPKQAGYALGFRHAWELAKSISTIGAAEGTKAEATADTGAENLEHLNP